MLGMLTLGLVAGAALGGYAVSKRGQLRGLFAYAQRMGELADTGTPEAMPSYEVTVPRSNHRRKATSEV
jgi:hypothetical protein